MELTVLEVEGQLVTDSRDVAEMISKKHSHLMRDIQGYKRVLDENPNLDSQNFFIPHTYKVEGNNKTYDCFLLTRKGCDMVANKMTGEKGVLFTAAYVTRFEEMEKQLKVPTDSLELALQAALQHEREIKSIKSDVDYLKSSMRIDTLQQFEIKETAQQSVIQALGGKESNAYQSNSIRAKAFRDLWGGLNRHFKIPRYGDLPKSKFDEALHYIKIWRPSTSLQLEIDLCNAQMVLGGE